MHAPAFAFVARVLKELPPRRAVVEIGSRDVNGSVRQLFMGAQYLGIDVREGAGVDLVADGAAFEPDYPPDTVVSCEVLEHAENADALVFNACKMLAPGGVFIMTCATDPRRPHSADDGGAVRAGEFYRNVSAKQFSDWCEAWSMKQLALEVDERAGDLRVALRKD